MRIGFHGVKAASFSQGFGGLVGDVASIHLLPDILASRDDELRYSEADVIVGVRFGPDLPRPRNLQLFHVPGAGYDAVDFGALPPSAVVCNCFGHEQAIAEYVM